MAAGDVAAGTGVGVPFTTIIEPLDGSKYVVPPTVTAGPPGVSVIDPATITWEAEFWTTGGAPVPGAAGAAGAEGVVVMPFITTPDPVAGSESVVPSTVTAGPPGDRV
jgi:hypothetical protein